MAAAVVLAAGLAGSAPAQASSARADGPSYRLVDEGTGDWAKNFPPSGQRPPFATSVVLDKYFASIYERWNVQRFEDGYSIQDAGTGFWATHREGQVLGTSEFDPGNSVWSIQPAGPGVFTIGKRGQDLLWTEVDHHVELKPADGSPAQLWKFERLDY
ncbi:hypothetical protein ABZX95_40365 [Streptomyces sp. NPDC004232]|uniref:RICIN domain-containing protein n=1 Tax=unclassified Streptomyces TaxID=2593676 RepID=UPI001DD1D9FD|nr:hypothetical protein [Streptomyces sp. tea 10]